MARLPCAFVYMEIAGVTAKPLTESYIVRLYNNSLLIHMDSYLIYDLLYRFLKKGEIDGKAQNKCY